MELKRIDFDKAVIPANGKEYFMSKDLSVARYKELEQMEMEFYYGFDMPGMFTKLKEIYNDLNKTKMADASVKLYRVMEGVADRVDKRQPTALNICSLFLVTKDEDRTTWTQELANEKIEDWQKEGYIMDDFFSLAGTVVPGFIRDYQNILANTFLEAEEEEKPPSDKPKQQ